MSDAAGLIPVIIPVRDRLEPLLRLVDWLERSGRAEIWLLDNQSTFPALVEYLATTDHHVVHLPRNLWHVGPWLSGLVYEVGRECDYVVTDPDIVPDDACPLDVFDRLRDLLRRYPESVKAGLGLRIDDLPDRFEHKANVIRWESKFWADEIEPGVYRADVDTTFAMYRPRTRYAIGPALRTGFPYVARHLPWYDTSDAPSEELVYYRTHADPLVTNWGSTELPAWKRHATG